MAAGAGIKQTASAWDSGIKDHASRLITGKESSSHNASSLHNGVGSIENFAGVTKQNANKDGTLTNKSIQEAYASQAKQSAEAEKTKKAAKNSSTEDNQQPDKVSINGSEQSSDLG